MESPYKFLDFFTLNDQNIFFGRERETNILVADIVVNRLVVLFAKTGTGKTSLINAGVRPILEDRDFRTLYVRVEQDPTDAARDVLLREDLFKNNQDDAALSKQLLSVVKFINKPIVLFFDQFEEFFIQISDRETRRKFVSDIGEIYQNANSGVHLVFSMREEYFHEMDEFRSEIPSIFHKNSNLRLLPLDETQARDAIVKPADARGIKVETSLIQMLTQDLTQDGGINPTYLQIICDTLWRNKSRTIGNMITLEEYQQLGAWRQILDKRLEMDIKGQLVDTDLLPLLQRMIPELRTTRNTKYPRAISDLVKTLDTNHETLTQLISRLKEIFVVREITISGAPAVEWASDYLAERTEYLLVWVRSIDIKQRLQAAIGKARNAQTTLKKNLTAEDLRRGKFVAKDVLQELYLSEDEFDRFSKDIDYLTDLAVNEITFLFDAALFHRHYTKLWFIQVSGTDVEPLSILKQRIHDPAIHINLRLGGLHLLAELASEQSIALLGESLDEPDLALEALDILVDIQGDQATNLISQALQRDDLWEATAISLTRTGSEQAVSLLEPLLYQEDKLFQSLSSLERLSKSSSSQVRDKSKKALEQGITVLESLLKQGKLIVQAKSALKRLSLSGHDAVKKQANKALNRLESIQEEKPEPLDSAPPVSSLRETSPREWDRIVRYISQGTLVPIISNSFQIEQIFQGGQDGSSQISKHQQPDNEELTIEEQLTKEWAYKYGYPLQDSHDLSRVSQYLMVEQDIHWAREVYLRFLKATLLTIAQSDMNYSDAANELSKQIHDHRFSEIASRLDYPKFPQGIEDPLRLLARLPLPIYATTSYFDFLERTLLAVGKTPRTQICFWNGREMNVKPEHDPDPDFTPTPASPEVYHFYGLEDYPRTLVLSEEDYMNFLIAVIEDTNTMTPILPIRIRMALAESSLLLLGYEKRDWNFRVLYTLISKFRRPELSPRGIVIHPKIQFKAKNYADTEKALEYLRSYFDKRYFSVEWDNAPNFIYKLWEEWNKYMQGQEK